LLTLKEYNEKTFPYQRTGEQSEFERTINASPDAEIFGYTYNDGDIAFFVKGTVSGKKTNVYIPKKGLTKEAGYNEAINMIVWLSDMF
jgi:hypothetical protein